MTHYTGYDLALQQTIDHTARRTRHASWPERPPVRRRAARTLRRIAAGLDPDA